MTSTVSTDELVGTLRSRRAPLAWLALLAAGYLALVVCAAVPTAIGVVAAAALVLVAEVGLRRRARVLASSLQKLGAGVLARGLVRGLALTVYAARALPRWAAVVMAAAVVVVAVAGAARIGLGRLVARLRLPSMASRGLPLSLGDVPRALPAWTSRPGGLDAVVELVAAVGLASAAHSGHPAAWVAVGSVLAVLLAALPLLVLVRHARTLRRARPRTRVPAEVHRSLLEYAPTVLVYFGNTAAWKYQLEMWLRPLEATGERVAVVVRDRAVLGELAPTSVPIVCIPGSGALMGLPLPSPRAALYVGNGSANIHLLRRPGLRSCFIGHGDSDKPSSFNPVTRVYDEIWVAGPAGRERYAHAGVDIPADHLVEVGRPQLRELPRRPDAVPLLTVLYAPTWEGWDDDPFHSSLETMGPALVAALLARPGLRVMYRPHPRTGHREEAIRRAHRQVLALLSAAGADAGAGGRLGPPPSLPAPVAGDLLDRMAHERHDFSRAEHDAAAQRWTQSYWDATPGHRILVDPAPDLNACFEQADVLVADISSVTSDFLAADRPYAVVNVSADPADTFRARTPSTAGGFVLDGDLAQLDDILAAAAGDDPTRAARDVVRRHLLGPRTADPAETFRAAVRRVARADASGPADVRTLG